MSNNDTIVLTAQGPHDAIRQLHHTITADAPIPGRTQSLLDLSWPVLANLTDIDPNTSQIEIIIPDYHITEETLHTWLAPVANRHSILIHVELLDEGSPEIPYSTLNIGPNSHRVDLVEAIHTLAAATNQLRRALSNAGLSRDDAAKIIHDTLQQHGLTITMVMNLVAGKSVNTRISNHD